MGREPWPHALQVSAAFAAERGWAAECIGRAEVGASRFRSL